MHIHDRFYSVQLLGLCS